MKGKPMNKIPTEKELLEEVVFPICGVALSVIVLAFGAQLTITLLEV